MNDLVCPTCSTPDLAPDDMCRHTGPLCTSCCLGGEHDWYTAPPWAAA